MSRSKHVVDDGTVVSTVGYVRCRLTMVVVFVIWLWYVEYRMYVTVTARVV